MLGVCNLWQKREIFYYLKQANTDVYILQESYYSTQLESIWSAEWVSGIFLCMTIADLWMLWSCLTKIESYRLKT